MARTPRVSDGVVFRVFQNLLILDGERLSYRTLDVEQIGSVYETMMGFNLEVAQGRSIAIKPMKPHGAPTTISLDELLASKPADRAKWLKEKSDQSLTGQAATSLKEAATPEDAVAALESKVAFGATPRVVPAGAMVLQPSDKRRRSGSHYTPRTLTEPIVETTFQPIVKRLGSNPTPEQILDLKVCDPAMGSGEFLVAVCRFLAELLVKAWHTHKCVPIIPPDEDEILHARRIVAQRCLYGVDKNPMAVDLAKLSLWLATLAKDHPFTFLDHALRHGDSLVGLSKNQIEGFHWKPERQRDFSRAVIADRITRATNYRRDIREAADATPEALLSQKLALADEALNPLRFYGDLVIAAFFSESTDRQRNAHLDELAEQLRSYLTNVHQLELRKPLDHARRDLTEGDKAIHPFHWEIEFPEVFGRRDAGFDVFVGNPPFAGKVTITEGHKEGYIEWLTTIHDESHGNADLVSHFFRRAFDLLRTTGCFGLIATNTIRQGDTRTTGLRWLCQNGGSIYSADRHLRWPGLAAVIVSVVHVFRGDYTGPRLLDGVEVDHITAFLFHSGGHDDPHPLRINHAKSFQGSILLGQGFLFDDSTDDGSTHNTKDMHELLEANPSTASVIIPYIGVDEVHTHPSQEHHRYVINFCQLEEKEVRQNWPEALRLVEAKVKPERDSKSDRLAREKWWQHYRPHEELYATVRGLKRVLVSAQTSKHRVFAFQPDNFVYDKQLNVFAFASYAAFATLQSRPHEIWSLFFGSTFEDRPIYTLGSCFEAFPFPENFGTDSALESAGKEYYEFRAELMIRNNEGLTKTYNRFHDPNQRSPDILKLRELHATMDRAVLDAYGWTDLKPTCEFLLDYEEDEDEDEAAGGRRRKKPWRYRWPDDFRDEVLARLLELNRQRRDGAAERRRCRGEN